MLFRAPASIGPPNSRSGYHCCAGRPSGRLSLASVSRSTQRAKLDEHPSRRSRHYFLGRCSYSAYDLGSADSSSNCTASARLRRNAVDERLDGTSVPTAALCRNYSHFCESVRPISIRHVNPDALLQTSQGHFIRLPQTQSLPLHADASTVPPEPPVQLISKEDIANHLQAGKAKNQGPPPANRLPNEVNARRFSTAGPLPRQSQATFAAKARAAPHPSDNKVITMKRPASRTLKQVRQTKLQENSRDGTRLESASGGTGSLQVVNAINRVESRLSKRQF